MAFKTNKQRKKFQMFDALSDCELGPCTTRCDFMICGGKLVNEYASRKSFMYDRIDCKWVKGPDLTRARWKPGVTSIGGGKVCFQFSHFSLNLFNPWLAFLGF